MIIYDNNIDSWDRNIFVIYSVLVCCHYGILHRDKYFVYTWFRNIKTIFICSGRFILCFNFKAFMRKKISLWQAYVVQTIIFKILILDYIIFSFRYDSKGGGIDIPQFLILYTWILNDIDFVMIHVR